MEILPDRPLYSRPVLGRRKLSTLVLIGALVAGGCAVVVLGGAFVLPGLMLKTGCVALGILLAVGAWLTCSYCATSDSCDLPVSAYHQKYSVHLPD